VTKICSAAIFLIDEIDASMSWYIAFVKGIEPTATIGTWEELAPVATFTGQDTDVGTFEDLRKFMACEASMKVCSIIFLSSVCSSELMTKVCITFCWSLMSASVVPATTSAILISMCSMVSLKVSSWAALMARA